ncbi:hypothetical protein OBBRIDRAFT_767994 [Obba rivulosa]|uniref:Nucleolar pre-ribosomal-associated protein 1 n=1 Tax=Obba rivulosa TaxID=1052685 RepID=A0A8E2J5W8_9APHY|nr:hypothetical protein OBBRIDRAFT_767994 [Obba rivulosa]
MPSRKTTAERSQREVPSKQTYVFKNPEDLRRSLNAQDENGLLEAFKALRNQLTVKHDESSISAGDERLQFLRAWLGAASGAGAQEIFNIWDSANPRQLSLLSLTVAVLSAIISLLSFHYTDHPLALPVIKTLLSPKCAHKLNSYLGGSHTELILVTLKLFNSISNFAGGRERKAVLEAFAWETKSLPRILHMRRRAKADDTADILSRPDIRTLYVLFILTFVDSTTQGSVKAMFLEQRRETFVSIFKGLAQDPYSLVRKVLEVCWIGIWSDPKLRRTSKVNLFGETTIFHLLKLYDRVVAEGDDPEHIPADVVHHFLLAISTHPGIGICFRDNGWYPREIEDADDALKSAVEGPAQESSGPKGGRIYNKILANVVKSLKVNDDPRQQELAMKIFEACPELVASYWSAAALTLEPRLSLKWIANIAFFGSVISLPVPQSSFLLSESGEQPLYRPTPPPLYNVLENILPSVNMRNNLTRGLQSSSAMVQHCTALALTKCLHKYEDVVQAFTAVEHALEEDEEGQWRKRRLETEKEVRKRVPDFQVIVGFAQKWINLDISAKESSAGDDAPSSAQRQVLPNPTKRAMLAESAYRLLWLYHRCMPVLAAETRFDAGKLVHRLQHDHENTEGTIPLATASFDRLRQLHLLRLLRESDQFVWSARIDSSRSNLSVLLKLYIETSVPATKAAITSLLQHVLSGSILFQHDTDEVTLWLESLPITERAVDAKAPDGTLLTDERRGVVSFLDDCVLRCMKTPYRYLEESQSLWTQASRGHTPVETANAADEARRLPSPLLMTVLEQLGAKLKARILSPSDALGVVTYIRRLLWRLASKMSDLSFLHACARRLAELIQPSVLFPESSSLSVAILHEVELAPRVLQHLQSPEFRTSDTSSAAVQEFLALVEITPPNVPHKIRSYEVVDWLRLIQPVMRQADVARMLRVVEQLHSAALGELLEQLDPDQDVMSLDEDAMPPNRIGFGLLFSHCSNDQMREKRTRQILADALFTRSVQAVDVKRAVCLVHHRLSPSILESHVIRNLFFLLAEIIGAARLALRAEEFAYVVQYSIQSSAMKRYWLQSLALDARHGLDAFLKASLVTEQHCHLVDEYASFWALTIRDSLRKMDHDQVATAAIWLNHLDVEECFALVDFIGNQTDTPRKDVIELVDALLQVIAVAASHKQHVTPSRASTLLRLRPLLPRSKHLESILASATAGRLPLGYDGQPIWTTLHRQGKLSELTTQSEALWARRLADTVPGIDVAMFLDKETWHNHTVDIISSRMYRDTQARLSFLRWMESDKSAAHDTHHIARLIYAYFDSGAVEEPEIPVAPEAFIAIFNRFLLMDTSDQDSGDVPTSWALYADCIALMVERSTPSLRQQLSLAVQKCCASMRANEVSLPILTAWARLIRTVGSEIMAPVDVLVEQGLKWAVEHFSDRPRNSERSRALIGDLTKLLPHVSAGKNHLAEPVLTAIIQARLSEVEALQFARRLVQHESFKPAVVNRFIQTIIQHVDFYQLCAGSEVVRNGISHLLHVLFHLHPNNTCQPTHVQPLLRIYGGTLSSSDRRLLAIFRLFEHTRKMSVAVLFSRWSASGDVVSSSSLEAIQSLDPNLIFKTCLAFPQWRSLDEDNIEENERGVMLYDPVFVALLFAQVLSDNPPSSALDWLQVFRTNTVSLLIRALSSDDELMRQVAFAQIASLYKCMETADLQEIPHIMHILNLLKDLIVTPPGSDCPRLPTYITLLLSHALRGVFYPSNFIYPLTARFLLQRPEVDTQDVPMLYGMLYSSSEQWKKERGWMVRFLSDGLVGTPEWRILKRRHTWDLLASLFQSEGTDRALRHGILEVLANITCNAKAVTSLILKHALLAWMEAQIRYMHADEGIAWIKVLENILTVVDATKVETATNGEWRHTLSRCVSALLDAQGGLNYCTCFNMLNVFGFTAAPREIVVVAIRAILRLSLLPGIPAPDMDTMIARCLERLRTWEEELAVPPTGRLPAGAQPETELPAAPHASRDLFDTPSIETLHMWGECVQALWRVVMSMDNRSQQWDALTTRLLLWRSLRGNDEQIGEWARRQVVTLLRAY